jgi:hypothetical protein
LLSFENYPPTAFNGKAKPTGTYAVMNGPPETSGGPFRPIKRNQELGVTGVRHNFIWDVTGLDGLDTIAKPWESGRILSEANDPSPERPLRADRQRRQALTDTSLVGRLGCTRNSGVQSESRQ